MSSIIFISKKNNLISDGDKIPPPIIPCCRTEILQEFGSIKKYTLFAYYRNKIAAMVFNGSIGALQALGAGSNPVRCSMRGYSTTVSVGDFQSSDVGSIPITRSITLYGPRDRLV